MVDEEQKKIRLLHSFPDQTSVFKSFCDLTFDLPELENTFVDNLTETNLDELNSYDAIIVHYLRDVDASFISKKSINPPIALFSWGADIFNLGRFHERFLLPKTLRLKRRLFKRYPAFVNLKKQIHSRFPILLDYRKKNKERIDTLSKVRTITPVMPGDYHMLSSEYSINAELYHLNYVNPILEHEVKPASGNYILLGNSAHFTNNHIEAIDLIKHVGLDNRKLLIPLSYGDSDLATYVKEYAIKSIGAENVEILDTFLPADVYQAKLQSCEIVIMNHLRQQAVGNIMQALAIGSHVYLQKTTSVYDYLKANNFYIGTFEKNIIFEPLTVDQKIHNLDLVKKVFGKELQQQRLRDLLQFLIA
ncbi:MAG: TDP-N-acetylfucosamine:lipid II N-acetylfucosaminyltransferase [bacterium]|nr:TDP-N-acetylfucosamine:lipid II N-acetylfucosaminyltransferase [bacterium]